MGVRACRVGKEELQQELYHCRQSGQFAQAELDLAASALQGDLERAAELVLGMRARLNRCRRCIHGRRPGLSSGYCIRRLDLPLAYGHLRELPADRGAWCTEFVDQDAQGTGTRPAVAGHSSPDFALVTDY